MDLTRNQVSRPKLRLKLFSHMWALISLLIAPAFVLAQTTYDWTGTTNGNLSGTITNYTVNGTPGGLDTIQWNSASYTTAPTANADMTVGQLLFNSGNTAAAGLTFGAGTGTVTLNGVTGVGLQNVGIQMNNGSAAVTTGPTGSTGANFAIASSQSWINSSISTLTIKGTVGIGGTGGAMNLTLGGSGNSTISGNIGNGTGTLSLIKTDSGTVTTSGNNTYTGTVNVLQGTLVTRQTAASTIYVGDTSGSNSATLKFNGASPLTWNNSVVVQSGSSGTKTIGTQNANTAWTLAGNVLLNANVTLSQTANNGGTISGVISGTGAVSKTGSATLTLSGLNTYTGATSVNNGTLLVNGSLAAASATSVAAAATLGGSGVVNGTVTTAAGASAIIDPSDAAGTGIGKLTLGNLDASNGGVFKFTLGDNSTAGTTYDQIAITGALTANNVTSGLIHFNFTNSGAAQIGVNYKLFTFANQSGLDLADFVIDNGWIGSFTINTNDVTVNFSAVPEPSTYVMLFVGFGLVVWISRFKRVQNV